MENNALPTVTTQEGSRERGQRQPQIARLSTHTPPCNLSRSLHVPHKLPPELERYIINEYQSLPEPCLNFLAWGDNGCSDPWICGLLHPDRSPKLPLELDVPDATITAVCNHFHAEGYKSFYSNNVFVFSSCRYFIHDLTSEDIQAPRATRLLDFIDWPEWKNKGSELFRDRDSYKYHDEYRYLIHNLVLIERCFLETHSLRLHWDWILKVDWQTLS
jgi:hypothetical protein